MPWNDARLKEARSGTESDMFQDNSDLIGILGDVRRSVIDDRLIWCVAGDGFETTVSKRQGLILGRAWSPHFLRSSGAFWWEAPWTMFL